MGVVAPASRPGWRRERLLRRRWSRIVSRRTEKPFGALAFVLAIGVRMPIPPGNILPAFAVSRIAPDVLERAGVCAAVGVVALALSGTVVYPRFKVVPAVLVDTFAWPGPTARKAKLTHAA